MATKKARATKKSTAKKKQIGRPKTTGMGTPMVVRMHDPQIDAIDKWIGNAAISRPEAIRQLTTWALEHAKVPAAVVTNGAELHG